jgi:hypothetical protein
LAVVGLAVLASLVFSGCSVGPDASYGRSRGESLNGTGTLAALFRAKGHDVKTAVRLTHELDDWADVIVRFAPQPGPPERDEADWYDQWMDHERDRLIVYVPRDYDARADYWSAVLEQLSGENTPDAERERTRARKLRDEARSWPEHLPPPAKKVAGPEDWFAVADPKSKSAATCKALSGPWAVGLDVERAALPRHETLKVESETVLLTGDGLPLAITWTRFNDSRVMVLASGAFLLNAALVNPARRPLALRVVGWVGPEPRKVAFVEGPYVIGERPTMRSVFELLRVPPFGWVAAQMLALGLAASLARAPRLGRARPDPPSGADRPSAHAEALGELLARTRQPEKARAVLDAFRQWRRRPGDGPSVPV